MMLLQVLTKRCIPSLTRILAARNFAVSFADTPNPLCLKFLPDRELLGIVPGKEYRSLTEANDSALSKALLSFEGVQKLMFGKDFVSVTKKESADWELLKPKISQAIDQYIDTYKKAPEKLEEETKASEASKMTKESELEAVSMIKELIEFRIRPMLLDDGGDVQYRGFNPKTGV